MSGSDGDIPFEDQPARSKAAEGEGPVTEETPRTAPPTEERTASGPGSTRPTTMREDFGTLAEEGRKLWEAVENRIVGPMLRSYPDVARHLGSAAREVAAAYRSAVRSQEQVWRDRNPDARRETVTVEPLDESGATKESHGRAGGDAPHGDPHGDPHTNDD